MMKDMINAGPEVAEATPVAMNIPAPIIVPHTHYNKSKWP
jgi:hypothetical protein